MFFYSILSKEILSNSNFIQCMKTKTFEWILTNCKNWQYEVALNKEDLSKFNKKVDFRPFPANPSFVFLNDFIVTITKKLFEKKINSST